MSIFEYDEEQHLNSERAQAYREGENRLAKLLQLLSAAGRTEDLHRAIAEPAYRKQLYEEMHL